MSRFFRQMPVLTPLWINEEQPSPRAYSPITMASFLVHLCWILFARWIYRKLTEDPLHQVRTNTFAKVQYQNFCGLRHTGKRQELLRQCLQRLSPGSSGVCRHNYMVV